MDPGADAGAPITERRSEKSMRLNQMSTAEIVALINDEDATVAAAVRAALPQIAAVADLVADRIRRGGRIFYVGAGTSGRIGLLDALEWGPTFGADPGLVKALVAGGTAATVQSAAGSEDDAATGAADLAAGQMSAADVVVGIAASGGTPYVLGALRAARNAGAATVGVCCNPDAPMTHLVDIAIVAVVGPEILTGSTRMKAGTAQKMILNMISTAAMVALGKVYSNLMVDVTPGNDKLKARARRIVAAAASVSPDQASQVLEATGFRVKPAIVMAALGCDLATAQERLQRAGGFVRRAIERRDD